MLKEFLRIHELGESTFSIDLSKYTLTFDDGLYSHFFYWNLIKDIPTTKIFFIPTGAIRLEETIRPQYSGEFINFPPHKESTRKWLEEENTEDYMTVGEIKKMVSEGAIIGSHGHMHIENYDEDCLITRLEQFQKDNLSIVSWFNENLNFIPEHYSFPYNKEIPIQRAVISVEVGISNFYGKERKDISVLLGQF